MRYYEIVGRECSAEQDDPRRTLSLYVLYGEYTHCSGMIRQHEGRVVGVTKVSGGITIQVTCPTVDAAYELFASWLEHTSQGLRRLCVAPVVEREARLSVQRR